MENINISVLEKSFGGQFNQKNIQISRKSFNKGGLTIKNKPKSDFFRMKMKYKNKDHKEIYTLKFYISKEEFEKLNNFLNQK